MAAGAEENGKGENFDREVGHENPEGREGEGKQKGWCQPCGVMGRSAEGVSEVWRKKTEGVVSTLRRYGPQC